MVKSMSEKSSPQKNISTGTVAAVAEATINHPLWAIKLRQQANKPFTLNPGILYRGFTGHVISRIPTTSLQMLCSDYFQNNVFSTINSHEAKLILSGFFGGVMAAILQTPVELTMTYQHKYGKNFLSQVSNIVGSKGAWALQTGYGGTAFRLGSYTCCFFAIQPLLKNKLEKKYNLTTLSSHIASSVLAGTFSNPADVIKTQQQNELPAHKLRTIDAAKNIYIKKGLYGFFDGAASRGARVCSGIAIISAVNSAMNC